jgi:hypothetical protein
VAGGRWSRRIYGWLLRVYPAEFRERFQHDLEADFGQLLATRGRLAAWRRVLPDLARSLRTTHLDAHVERQRLSHVDPTEIRQWAPCCSTFGTPCAGCFARPSSLSSRSRRWRSASVQTAPSSAWSTPCCSGRSAIPPPIA